MTLYLTLLLAHFAWHLIATLGVAAGLIHSYTKHGEGSWKLMTAVLWLLLSILTLLTALDECHR